MINLALFLEWASCASFSGVGKLSHSYHDINLEDNTVCYPYLNKPLAMTKLVRIHMIFSLYTYYTILNQHLVSCILTLVGITASGNVEGFTNYCEN